MIEIALNSSYSSSRIKASEKIENEDVLKEIGLNDTDKFVRIEAIKHVKNENIIKEIYLQEKDSFVRSEAIKNINSLVNLIDISIKDDDLELLQDIATRDFAQYYQQLTPNLTIPSMVIHETADVNEVIGAVTNSITGFVRSSTYNTNTGSQAILPA